jgi:hypothetical protein
MDGWPPVSFFLPSTQPASMSFRTAFALGPRHPGQYSTQQTLLVLNNSEPPHIGTRSVLHAKRRFQLWSNPKLGKLQKLNKSSWYPLPHADRPAFQRKKTVLLAEALHCNSGAVKISASIRIYPNYDSWLVFHQQLKAATRRQLRHQKRGNYALSWA